MFWCRVKCFLVFAITDVRLRRVHNVNSIVDVEAIVFVRYEGVRSDILLNKCLEGGEELRGAIFQLEAP